MKKTIRKETWRKILAEYEKSKWPYVDYICLSSPTFDKLWRDKAKQLEIRRAAKAFCPFTSDHDFSLCLFYNCPDTLRGEFLVHMASPKRSKKK